MQKTILSARTYAGIFALLLACSFSGALNAQGVCNTAQCIVDRMASASPGDEIIVAPGNYRITRKVPTTFSFAFLFSDRDGTAARPITLRGQNPDNPPTISGSANNTGYLLSIEGDYWIVRDINFKTAAKGIMLDNANNCRLLNLSVSDTGEEGIHLRDGSSNNLVKNCRVFDTGRNKPGFGEGLYIGSDRKQQIERRDEVSAPDKARYRRACDNNTMEDCVIGPNITAEGVDIKEGTRRAIIRNNRFIARGVTGENSGDAFIDAKGSESFIYNNIFDARDEPNMLAGVDFQDRGTNFNTGTRIAIHNNEFLTNGRSATVRVARKKGGDPSAVHVWGNRGLPSSQLFGNDGTLRYVTQNCPDASWNNVISCNGGTPPPPPPPTPTPPTTNPPANPCAGSGSGINGRIQAENFCAMNGIRTQNTSDSGGGQNVGYIDQGDYMDYRINVPSAGTYQLTYRVASSFATGEVEFRTGGRTLATTSIPNTGNWQAWRSITTNVTLAAGSQTVRLFASGPRWNINWFTLSANSTPPTPTPPTTGGGDNNSGCSFGAPGGGAIPTLDRVSFSNVHVLGSGGPALSNFRKFTINYDAPANGLYSLAINTDNGRPAYYVNLLPGATARLNRSQPDLTLSNTGLAGLDGAYWFVRDGNNIALVSKTGGYTVYFSNNGSAPSCGNARLTTGTDNRDFRAGQIGTSSVTLYPNPVTDVLNVAGLHAEAGTYQILDLRGAVLRSARFGAGAQLRIALDNVPSGSYILRVEQASGQLSQRFIRQTR